MSNRDAVPDTQKDTVWRRDIEDRMKALETRKVQGNLTLDDTTVASLTVGASSGAPLVLQGSDRWTQAVEDLGGDDALVLRDELGIVQDISPAPFAQYFQGAGTNIPTGATGAVVGWAANQVTFGPYSRGAMLNEPQGALITPVAGLWRFDMMVLWQAFADATARNLSLQLNNAGVWNDFVIDTKVNTSGVGLWQSYSFTQNAEVGYQWRLRATHNSVGTPLSCTGIRFQQTFIRAPSVEDDQVSTPLLATSPSVHLGVNPNRELEADVVLSADPSNALRVHPNGLWQQKGQRRYPFDVAGTAAGGVVTTGTWLILPWRAERYDPDGMVDLVAAPTRVTFPEAQRSLQNVSFQTVLVGGTVVQGIGQVVLVKNGTEFVAASDITGQLAAGATAFYGGISTQANVVAGDYLEVWFRWLLLGTLTATSHTWTAEWGGGAFTT